MAMIRLKSLPAGFPGKPPARPSAPRSLRKRAKVSPKPPATPEREIQRSIVAYLESLGACVIRVNSGAVKAGDRFTRFNSLPGCPDLLVCLNSPGWKRGGGVFLAIEVKTAKGKTTDLQNDALCRLEEAGAVVIVARSIDDVKRVLETEGLV